MLAIGMRAHQLDNVQLRDRKFLLAGLDDQCRHDRERQRDLDDECRPLAGLRLEVAVAANQLDIGSHHIHTDAASRHTRDLGRRGEAWGEDVFLNLLR